MDDRSESGSASVPDREIVPDEIRDRITEFIRASMGTEHEVIGIVSLRGDASDRRYFRVRVRDRQSEPVGCYVVMVLDRPWQGDTNMEELPFVNIARHLARLNIPVPEIYGYDRFEGVLLMEDLGDLTLQDLLQGCAWSEQRHYYEEAVELLVAMQRAGHSLGGTSCYAMKRAFDAETFFNELVFFLEHAVEGLWGKTIAHSDREEIEAQFRSLCEQIACDASVFTHRDYHSRNLMVKEQRLRVLDFQDARLGPALYDVSSLLRDSYVELGQEAVGELLRCYRKMREDFGYIEYDVLCELFDRTSIQRNLKAMGTFAFQYVRKGREEYLQYIPRTMGYVRANLSKYKDLSDLKRILDLYTGEIR